MPAQYPRQRIGFLSHARTAAAKAAVAQRDLGQCQDCLAEEPPITTNWPPSDWRAVHRVTTHTINDNMDDFRPQHGNPDHPDNLITLCLNHIDYRQYGQSITDFRRPTTPPPPQTQTEPSQAAAPPNLQPAIRQDPLEVPDDAIATTHKMSATTRGQLRIQAHKEHISRDKMYRRIVEAGWRLYSTPEFRDNPDEPINLSYKDIFPEADLAPTANPDGVIPPPRYLAERHRSAQQQQRQKFLQQQNNNSTSTPTELPALQRNGNVRYPTPKVIEPQVPTHLQGRTDTQAIHERIVHFERIHYTPNQQDLDYLDQHPEITPQQLSAQWRIDNPDELWDISDQAFMHDAIDPPWLTEAVAQLLADNPHLQPETRIEPL